MDITIEFTNDKSPGLLTKLWWGLNDLCTKCGGELNIFDYKRASCKSCGAKN